MAEQARDTSFDRIAILVLAVEWVLFGSMHFSAVEETVAQIPEPFPFKHHLAIVTGIAEVATGILSWSRSSGNGRRRRRWSCWPC